MEKVKGYIDHIIYQNRENGYAVISFVEEKEELICVGYFKNVEAGETLEIEGKYVEHPVYGLQMKAENFRVVPPDDIISMERYLRGYICRGRQVSACKSYIL